ncbi:hypothetical protein KL906_001439 [Ogataea polymorpha]|nr:hypothetical protein KL908_002347 [Ogataea polymorpha]KAG7911059.1 hypothetical protein KL906_001439 [Ogataea polymorpha]KAG7918395.1 hypothetical protein KL927_001852 [Ogataea polymorpha]KAG7931571.1 hypothetical protein KL934_003983 [Ogataea polymorpha]
MINSQDKELIKRAIPKASNKILAAAVAKLYIAYPEPDHWTPTGLAGAIVLVDDLVGHTFFLKLVDIVSHKGVLWDQELYIDFEYNQDRSFFHSFECEECYFGLLFEDKSEASSFYKKVKSRDKHGSKQTVQNKHGVELKKEPTQVNKIGFRGDMSGLESEQRTRRTKGLIYYEDEPPPEWRSLYRELESVGITEDMIAENREFIKDYIAQTGGPLVGLEPPIPRKYQYKSAQRSTSGTNSTSTITKKAPPPPPPQAAQKTASTQELPKSDPPSTAPWSAPSRQDTPVSDLESPAPEPTVTHPAPPPPMHHNVPALDYMPNTVRQRQSQEAPLPPEPQQPRGVPLPPPRANAVPPPPPPSRNPVPPPPPSRTQPQLPPRESRPAPVPPPPRRGPAPPPPPSRSRPVPGPPQISSPTTTHPIASPPPQLPPHHPNPVPSAPSLHPSQQVTQSPYAQTSSPIPQAPPPPPMQPATAQPSQSAPPPPPFSPAAPQSGSVPPPPPMPPANDTPASPPPGAQLDGRDALLASIRNAGVGSLRKIDKSQLEKPNVLLQEARGEAPKQPASTAAPGQPASLADALAAALSNRKAKVANSDDEDDGDW